MKNIIQIALIALTLTPGIMASEMGISSDRIQSENKDIQKHVIQLSGYMGDAVTYKFGDLYYTITLRNMTNFHEMEINRGSVFDKEYETIDNDDSIFMYDLRNANPVVLELFRNINYFSNEVNFGCLYGQTGRIVPMPNDELYDETVFTYPELRELFEAIATGTAQVYNVKRTLWSPEN